MTIRSRLYEEAGTRVGNRWRKCLFRERGFAAAGVAESTNAKMRQMWCMPFRLA